MILPPHILKYQKQLQELNKKASSLKKNDANKKNNEKENKNEKEKEIKGKNKHSNKFLQTNNSSSNLPPHLKSKELSISQNSDKNLSYNLNPVKNNLSLEESEHEEEEENDNYNEEMSQSKLSQENKKLSKREEKMKENWRIYRKGAGVIWQDESLNEWPENDYRMFIGDLGNEVNDQVLANAFIKYPSFAKAKVIRNKITGKTKGYGFVSVTDVWIKLCKMKR